MVKSRKSSSPAKPAKSAKSAKPSKPASAKKDGIDKKVAIQSIEALLKYTKKGKEAERANKKNQLIEDDVSDDDIVSVSLQAKKFITPKGLGDIRLVPVNHPFFYKLPELRGDHTKVCLIVKDPEQAYRSALEEFKSRNPSCPIEEVISFTRLKLEYKSFEARRQLAALYDMFVVDKAIVSALPQFLGKVFYQGSKAKMPLKTRIPSKTTQSIIGKEKRELTEEELQEVKNSINMSVVQEFIMKAQSSVPIAVNSSSNLVVPVGTVQMTAQQIYENIAGVAEYFKKEFVAGVEAQMLKSVMVKTPQSPAIPVYYASIDKIYGENDVAEAGEKSDEEGDRKRKREEAEKHLTKIEKALVEVVDEEVLPKKLKQKALA